MTCHRTLGGMLIILTLFLSRVYTCAAICPPGDLTRDCQVNLDDLVVLAQHWLDGPGSSADIDGGGVGLSDFGILSENWQKNSIILKVTVRNSYLPGIPFLVRAELLDENGKIRRDIWDAAATLSVVDNPSISLSATQIHLINGLGSVLVTPSGNGVFTLKTEVLNRSVTKTLTQLDPAAITMVSGSLSSSQTWNGVYHITGGDFAIPGGLTLTLNPGTMILIDGVASGTTGGDINISGTLQSLGTADSPVTITAFETGKNFGELHFSSAQPSFLQYTDIHRGGRSPGIGHTGTGPTVRVNNSTIVFDHSNITDTAGKSMNSESVSSLTFRHCQLARSIMGPEIAGTALLFEDSWTTDMRSPNDSDGFYVMSQSSGQSCVFRGGVSAFVDDDGIDLLSPTITIEDYWIHDTKDKGLSIYNGTTTIRKCLIVETNILPEDPTVAAVAAKADNGGKATVNIDRTTIVASRMAGRTDYGIQSNNKYGVTSGRIYWTITNSIVDATDPVKVDLPYLASDIAISYSDLFDDTWPGTGNLHTDPLFVDRAGHDYHLAAGSGCIDAGDPAQTDPDGSRTDQGYFPYGSKP
jgi:hypothetical protein